MPAPGRGTPGRGTPGRSEPGPLTREGWAGPGPVLTGPHEDPHETDVPAARLPSTREAPGCAGRRSARVPRGEGGGGELSRQLGCTGAQLGGRPGFPAGLCHVTTCRVARDARRLCRQARSRGALTCGWARGERADTGRTETRPAFTAQSAAEWRAGAGRGPATWLRPRPHLLLKCGHQQELGALLSQPTGALSEGHVPSVSGGVYVRHSCATTPRPRVSPSVPQRSPRRLERRLEPYRSLGV